ncbi:MAG: hypothetical protein LR011_00775 [Verrucomicrobia bacterium]|nr:hypothetical protein [Verrucomicrobiota bacterium]
MWLFCSCDNQPGKEGANEKLIRELWMDHQTAKENRDGDKAAAHFSLETIAHYNLVADLARTATRSQLEQESLGRCFSILKTRLNIPADELKSLTGRDIVARNYTDPALDPSQSPKRSLGSIIIVDNRATVAASYENDADSSKNYFIKETDGWKIDGISALEDAEKKLEARRQSLGLQKTEFVKKLLEQSRGQAISENIWLPKFQRTPF